jgi:hypothetical protein
MPRHLTDENLDLNIQGNEIYLLDKGNDTVVTQTNITNLEILQGRRQLKIGETSKNLDLSKDLIWTLEDIGVAPAVHDHDDVYYTEEEVNSKIDDINNSITSALNASKDYTNTAITALIDSAPEAMNTLNELASSINEHQTEYDAYVATVSNALAGKADKEHGTHLVLGTEQDTAFRGDYGNIAYDHSQEDHAPSNAQKNSDITKAEIEAKLTGDITSHTHDYLPLTGGTLNGSLTIAEQNRIYLSNNNDYINARIGVDPDNGDVYISNINNRWLRVKADDTLEIAGSKVYTEANKPTPEDIDAAPSSHTHNAIVSRGSVTCESGATGRPAVSGLSMTEAYNNGYPTTYGNVINLRGAGDGQILVGWSGSDVAHSPMYVRSKRDNTSTANWSGWAQVYTTAHKPTPADIGAAAASHGTHLTIGTGAGNAAAGNHSHTRFTRSSVGDIGWGTSSNHGLPIAVSAIAYWNGAYEGTSSNLTYCKHGAFGSIVTKNSGDYAPASHGTHLTIGTGAGNAAAGNHTHSYLPLSGGTLTGHIKGNHNVLIEVGYLHGAWGCKFGGIQLTPGGADFAGGHHLYTNANSSQEYNAFFKTASGTVAYITDISDRTQKENIVYINKEDSEVTYEEMYDFIKDDLELATYNLKNPSEYEEHRKINFIAQDILCNEDQTENKVGNLIVIAQKCMEDQGVLQYDTGNYVSVLAGALKESINKIEKLESKNKVLEELAYSLNERLSKLENK